MTSSSARLIDGFINFSSRDWSRRGDKESWARFDAATGKLTVQRGRGIMSDDYESELAAFCAAYGIDFSALHSNEKATAIVEADVAPNPKGIDVQQAVNNNFRASADLLTLAKSFPETTPTQVKELMARMSCAVMWLPDELDKRTGTAAKKWIENAHKAFPGMPGSGK